MKLKEKKREEKRREEMEKIECKTKQNQKYCYNVGLWILSDISLLGLTSKL